ncbi:Zn finger homeodomain 2 [Musca autumnalis]|uniref:Zn finger homeodomain 2 n=1 Tax=Musca autumnalis TaxID=221902 RepID=UPI003CF8CD07
MFTVDTENVPLFTSRQETFKISPHTSPAPQETNSPRIHTFKIIKASDVTLRYHQIRNTILKSLKPILMCFICKLSFGVTKLFVVHANKEHGIDLKDFEKNLLLNRNNVSAIIQRNMDENLQISFLEPDSPETKNMFKASEDHMQLKSTEEANNDNDTSSNTSFDNKNNNKNNNAPLFSSTSCLANSLPDTSSTSAEKSLKENTEISPEQFVKSETCEDVPLRMTPTTTTTSTKPSKSPDLTTTVKPPTMLDSAGHNEMLTAFPPEFNYHEAIAGLSLSKSENMNWESKKHLPEPNSPSQASLQMSALHASWFVLSAEQNYGNVQIVNDFLQQRIAALQQQNSINMASAKDSISSVGPTSCPLHGDKKGIDCKVCEMIPIRLKIREQANKSSTPLPLSNTNLSSKNTSHRQGMSTPSFVIGVCSDHINGRPLNVECMRCELILNSARLNANTQQSTRNSCKTLKCPQCNWHYKYQETLEIHMREKHPDGESACGYCLAGQQHPRLARGESYSCGYKPYRCDICNYSTTTKGNLSIHMQSDKHLNNVQELNSTRNMVATSDTNNGVIKFDALAANYISQYNAMSQHRSQMPVVPCCDTKPNPPVSNVNEREENVDRNRPVFRCDMCNYETSVARNLRIHMTSEKHIQNLTMLQSNIKKIQALSIIQQHQNQILPNSPVFVPNVPTSSDEGIAQFAQSPSAAAVANRDANIGNTEEDKLKLEFNSVSDMISSQHATSPTVNIEFPFKKQFWPTELYSCLICENFNTSDVDALYQHLILDRSLQVDNKNDSKMASSNCAMSEDKSPTSCELSEISTIQNNNYICFLCKYKTNLKANFQLHSKTDKHLQKLNFFNHLREGGPNNKEKIKYYQQQHMGINVIQIKCNCCDLLLNSIYQLKLHVKHIRHEGMKVIFLHLNRIIRRNSSANIRQCIKVESETEESKPLKNKVLFCKICNIAVSSLIKMLHHVKTFHSIQVETFIEMGGDGERLEHTLDGIFCLYDGIDNDKIMEEREGDNSSPESNIIENNTENIGACQLNNFEKVDVSNSACRSSPFQSNKIKDAGEATYSCDYCGFCANSSKDIQIHMTLEHQNKESLEFKVLSPNNTNDLLDSNELQNRALEEKMNKEQSVSFQADKLEYPGTLMQCPLCQENFFNLFSFDSHLKNVHNIDRDGLIRLIIQLRTLMSKENGENFLSENRKTPIPPVIEKHIVDTNVNDTNITSSSPSPSEVHRCQKCDCSFRQEQQLLLHAQQLKHYTLEDGEYLCLASNNILNACHLRFPTPISMFSHYHDKHINLIISDRHVYKYRCKQCSLAFKTREKLSTHLMYHTFRDTTKCRKCMRNFRSIHALHSHMQLCHGENKESLLYAENVIHNTIHKPDLEADISSSSSSIHTIEEAIPCSSTSSRLEKPREKGLVVSLPAEPEENTRKPMEVETIQNAERCEPVDNANTNLHSLQQIATAAAASGLVLNPVEMLNIIQFHHLMSLNIMNLSPPLVLDSGKAASGIERAGTMKTEVRLDAPKENTIAPAAPKTPTTAPLLGEDQTQRHKRGGQSASMSQMYCSHKRARTRITNDQLKILRSHFDINNSPSEENIAEMSRESNLPIKVIKHWFRNTLFKERQRNKDSPYNFNNPPSTTLNIEEYEKNVQAKLDAAEDFSCHNNNVPQSPIEDRINIAGYLPSHHSHTQEDMMAKERQQAANPNSPNNKQGECHETNISNDSSYGNESVINKTISPAQYESMCLSNNSENLNCDKSESNSSETSRSQTPNSIQGSAMSASMVENNNQQMECGMQAKMGPPKVQQITANACNNPGDRAAAATTTVSLLQSNNRFDKVARSPHYESASNTIISCNSGGKRANRTRFTDYQIKVLQEFFENNSYPKDSDLEYLSKLLLLSPRVIVVWFQNARQKQRKIYENQPNNAPCDTEEKKQNINYTCKRCHLVFQRYYELIRHQKNHCFKEENNKRSAKAQKAAAQIAQHLSSEDSNSSMDVGSTTSSSLLARLSPLGSTSNSASEFSLRNSKDLVAISSKANDMDCDELMTIKCQKCNMSFSDRNKLRQHEIIHLADFGSSNLKSPDVSSHLNVNPFCNLLQQLHQKSSLPQENDGGESSNKAYVCKRKYSDMISNEDNYFPTSDNLPSTPFDTASANLPLLCQEINQQQQVDLSKLRDNDFLIQYYERNKQVKYANFELAANAKPSIEFLWQYYQMMESYKHFQLEQHQQQLFGRKFPESMGFLTSNNGTPSPTIESCLVGTPPTKSKSADNSQNEYDEKNVRLFEEKDRSSSVRRSPMSETNIEQNSETSVQLDQLDGPHEVGDGEFDESDGDLSNSEFEDYCCRRPSLDYSSYADSNKTKDLANASNVKSSRSEPESARYHQDELFLKDRESMSTKVLEISNRVKHTQFSNYMIEVN